MNQANKIKLGAFLIIAVLLIMASFLSVGILKFFEPRFMAMTVLNASVEGLSVGSPVKYMGVPVGRVTRIAMRDEDGYIDVYFTIFVSAIDRIGTGEPIASPGRNVINNIIGGKELSCFLNASGIMGGAYLELHAGEGAKFALPDLKVSPPPGYSYIRSRTSHVSNVIQNISQTLEQLTKVDFANLADKLDRTLDGIGQVVNNDAIGEMLGRFNRISQDIEHSAGNLKVAFSEERIQSSLRTVDYLEDMVRRFHDVLPPEKLASLTGNLDDLLRESRDVLTRLETTRVSVTDDVRVVRQNLGGALLQLRHTLADFSQLVNSLDENPSQLIRGKSAKPFLENP